MSAPLTNTPGAGAAPALEREQAAARRDADELRGRGRALEAARAAAVEEARQAREDEARRVAACLEHFSELRRRAPSQRPRFAMPDLAPSTSSGLVSRVPSLEPCAVGPEPRTLSLEPCLDP